MATLHKEHAAAGYCLTGRCSYPGVASPGKKQHLQRCMISNVMNCVPRCNSAGWPTAVQLLHLPPPPPPSAASAAAPACPLAAGSAAAAAQPPAVRCARSVQQCKTHPIGRVTRHQHAALSRPGQPPAELGRKGCQEAMDGAVRQVFVSSKELATLHMLLLLLRAHKVPWCSGAEQVNVACPARKHITRRHETGQHMHRGCIRVTEAAWHAAADAQLLWQPPDSCYDHLTHVTTT